MEPAFESFHCAVWHGSDDFWTGQTHRKWALMLHIWAEFSDRRREQTDVEHFILRHTNLHHLSTWVWWAAVWKRCTSLSPLHTAPHRLPWQPSLWSACPWIQTCHRKMSRLSHSVEVRDPSGGFKETATKWGIYSGQLKILKKKPSHVVWCCRLHLLPVDVFSCYLSRYTGSECPHGVFFRQKSTGRVLGSAGMKHLWLREKNAARVSCRHDNNISTRAAAWSTLLHCFYCLFSGWNPFFHYEWASNAGYFSFVPCTDDELNNKTDPLTLLQRTDVEHGDVGASHEQTQTCKQAFLSLLWSFLSDILYSFRYTETTNTSFSSNIMYHSLNQTHNLTIYRWLKRAPVTSDALCSLRAIEKRRWHS